VRALVAVYLLGVLIALWRTDASPLVRVAIALLWPIGPLALVVTVSILLVAAVIAFPMFGAAVAAATALTWWALR